MLLVAASAKCRKSTALAIGLGLLKDAQTCHIMAERITNAALLTELAEAATLRGRSEMTVFADELAMFLSKEETHKGLLTSLTRFYGSPDHFKNKLKTVPVDVLKDVCLNIMAATTPADLSDLIPDAATGKGFTPRLHLIFQDERRHKKATPREDLGLRAKLVGDLVEIRKMEGPFVMNKEAEEWWVKWYEKIDFPPDPELDGFYGRKHDHMLKLAMILGAAQSDRLEMTIDQMEKASLFLDQMEAFMPRAYRVIGHTETSEHADRVVKQVERRGGKATRSDILHDNWHKFTAKQWEEEVLPQLVAGGVLDPPEKEGRAVVYRLAKGRRK